MNIHNSPPRETRIAAPKFHPPDCARRATGQPAYRGRRFCDTAVRIANLTFVSHDRAPKPQPPQWAFRSGAPNDQYGSSHGDTVTAITQPQSCCTNLQITGFPPSEASKAAVCGVRDPVPAGQADWDLTTTAETNPGCTVREISEAFAGATPRATTPRSLPANGPSSQARRRSPRRGR